MRDIAAKLRYLTTSHIPFLRLVQIFSAISLVIPACLQIELNVPFGILLLFRGTNTTLFSPP